MNIYDKIKAELHRCADYNQDGKINRSDIEAVVASIKLRVGTGWQSYAAATAVGFVVGALVMWAF